MPPPVAAAPGTGHPGMPPAPGWYQRAPLPPPRRKSNPAAVIVPLTVVGFMIIAPVAAIGLSLSGRHSSDYGSSTSSSTSGSYDSTYSSTYSSSNSSTYSSTPSSSSYSTESGEDTASSTPATLAGPHPVASLGDNPINMPEKGAVNTPCSLPRLSTDIDSQQAFFETEADCLIRAWTPALQAANLPIRRPNVVATGSDVVSPCGRRRWNETALYCSGNHTIYMTVRHYSEVEQKGTAGVYFGQFAHEVGHAIQGMAGIMDAKATALYDAGGSDTPNGLEISRRTELQATCFGGMSYAAFQNGGVDNNRYIMPALQDAGERGDEYGNQPDHGVLATNKSWVQQGFRHNEVYQCDTWKASSSDVK